MRICPLIFTVLMLPFAALAQAAGSLPPMQPYVNTGYYDVSWSGITVGGMVIDANEDADSYAMEAQVKSNGLAWTFTKHESVTTVEGDKRNGEYLPRRFETNFSLRKKNRHIVLDYNADGHLVHEVNTPPEDRKKRPEVPMELKRDVVDALTPFFLQRKRIYEALRNGEEKFTIRMYDGRRLTDLEYFVQGRKQLGWNMQDTPVIHFTLSRSPVAGYKDSELEDIAENKDPAVSLYLSDDGRLIPLKIIIDSSAGKFYANYKQDCPDKQACLRLLE